MPSTSASQQALRAYEAGYDAARQNHWSQSRSFFAQALLSDPGNIRYALFLGGALWHTGRKEDAVALWSLAADKDPAIRVAQYQPQADPLTRQVSHLADHEIRAFLTDLQAKAVTASETPGRISGAVWPQTHYGQVTYPEAGPKPYMFYVPDLPPIPIFDRKATEWTQGIEAACPAITQDYLSLVQSQIDGVPYVRGDSALGPEWNPLKGQNDWHSIHLYQNGSAQPAAQSCVQTREALKDVPLVFHNGNPMEVFFSVLKPNTHIPPHFGLANSRVTVHLPLIIPPKCAIRVGKTQHHWTAGETLVFDDSFDHEAWNHSDETRVVLIFEAWRPDMTQGEIDAVKRSFAYRDKWLNKRRSPDLAELIGAT